MTRKLILLASALGALSIILGAFGAHALKGKLTESALNAFEVGVRYQMYHVFMLLFVAVAPVSEKARNVIFWLVLSGVTLFSGSLYLLSLQGVLTTDLGYVGPLTPIGGFLLIFAWLWLFSDFVRKK